MAMLAGSLDPLTISAAVQANFTLLIFLVTWWYACTTKRILGEATAERRRRQHNALRAVLLELQENKHVLDHCHTATNGTPRPGVDPRELSLEAWSSLKPDLPSLPSELMKQVFRAYAAIAHSNEQFKLWSGLQASQARCEQKVSWGAASLATKNENSALKMIDVAMKHLEQELGSGRWKSE